MPFQLFGFEGLAPHGTCLLWLSDLFWTHATSDTLISLSYASISLSLFILLKRRDGRLLHRMGILFAAFILFCCLCHAMDVWTLWVPDYGAQAVVKVATAVVSLMTAALLWPAIPVMLALPTLGQLEAANAALRREVAERQQAEATQAAYADKLERSNHHLEQTLSRLHQTQAQLLQSEKMASLGGMVAGIAHEINTPVGNGIAVATSLAGAVKRFRQRIAGEAIKRSHLEAFAADMEEAAGLIATSLETAAGLVHSFKQVAADQTSSQRRRFDLRETIDEIIATLRPRFKHTPYILAIAVPSGIAMDSYPGPLGQVITNLMTNSLFHAFEGRDHGKVTLMAEIQEGGRVVVTYADDGNGIPQKLRDRVFEPFFTTRQGSGGTGLGLHVVFNIVTNVLGGSIALRTDVGEGVEFRIDLPLTAPTLTPVSEAE